MGKIAIVAVIIGGCLIWFGIQEYRVGADASTVPVPVELADLEAGKPLPDNHIRIGLNHCMYGSVVFEYESEEGKMKASSEVNWTYTPLISDQHPYMQKLRALEKRYGGLNKIPNNADWPVLGNFVVLLKSEVHKTVGDIPDVRMVYDSATGLVINEVDPLGEEEKRLIRQGLSGIDFDKVFIVEQWREPTSAGASIGIIAGGALLVLIPVTLGIRSCRKPASLPAEKPAAQSEPAPDDQEEPADVEAPIPPDRNPYRGE